MSISEREAQYRKAETELIDWVEKCRLQELLLSDVICMLQFRIFALNDWIIGNPKLSQNTEIQNQGEETKFGGTD